MTLLPLCRRVMAIVLTLGLGATSALAQGSDAGGPAVPPPPEQGSDPGAEERPTPRRTTPATTVTGHDKRNHIEIGLRFMAVLPTGTAFDATSEDYSDLWGQGTDFGFHAAFMTTRIRKGTRKPVGSFGAYLAIDRYSFPAEDHTFPSGNRMTTDDFTMTTILFGARLDLPTTNIDRPVRFVGGLDVGLGFALMDGIDTFYDQTPNGGFAADEAFYDDTVSFGFEFTLRLGLAIRVSPTVELLPAFILGYNFFIGPDNATDDGSKRLKDADAGLMFNVFFGLSVATAIILPERQ